MSDAGVGPSRYWPMTSYTATQQYVGSLDTAATKDFVTKYNIASTHLQHRLIIFSLWSCFGLQYSTYVLIWHNYVKQDRTSAIQFKVAPRKRSAVWRYPLDGAEVSPKRRRAGSAARP
jgi:hypothetical protein